MVSGRRLQLPAGDAGSWGGLEPAEKQEVLAKQSHCRKWPGAQPLGSTLELEKGLEKGRKAHTLGEQVRQGPQSAEGPVSITPCVPPATQGRNQAPQELG